MVVVLTCFYNIRLKQYMIHRVDIVAQLMTTAVQV